MLYFTSKKIGIFYKTKEQKETILNYLKGEERNYYHDTQMVVRADRNTGGYWCYFPNIEIYILPISESIRGLRFNEIYICEELIYDNYKGIQEVVLPSAYSTNINVIESLSKTNMTFENFYYYELKKDLKRIQARLWDSSDL